MTEGWVTVIAKQESKSEEYRGNFKATVEGCCAYSEGVASHSPGLSATRATLGWIEAAGIYPERVAAFDKSR